MEKDEIEEDSIRGIYYIIKILKLDIETIDGRFNQRDIL